VFPGQTTDTITIDVQSLVADTHLQNHFAEMDGSGKNISSIIICSHTRDVGVANDYANDAYFLEDDFHFALDAMGSRLKDDSK